jgi:hypothetical protein
MKPYFVLVCTERMQHGRQCRGFEPCSYAPRKHFDLLLNEIGQCAGEPFSDEFEYNRLETPQRLGMTSAPGSPKFISAGASVEKVPDLPGPLHGKFTVKHMQQEMQRGESQQILIT